MGISVCLSVWLLKDSGGDTTGTSSFRACQPAFGPTEARKGQRESQGNHLERFLGAE